MMSAFCNIFEFIGSELGDYFVILLNSSGSDIGGVGEFYGLSIAVESNSKYFSLIIYVILAKNLSLIQVVLQY